MIEIIFFVVMGISILGVVCGIDRAYVLGSQRKTPAQITSGCPHIWSLWEQFDLRVVNSDGKFTHNQASQKRHCEMCNYEEREKLTIFK